MSKLSDARTVARERGYLTVSLLQRRLMLGYSDAKRLLDQAVEHGIVGERTSDDPKQYLLPSEEE